MRSRCGARTRAGHPCRAPHVRGKKRCRMHGGLSTGPKTQAGRERVREGYRRSLIEDLEQRERDRAAGRYAPYYRGADLCLRARYGPPSDRRRFAGCAADPAREAESHRHERRKPDLQSKPSSGPQFTPTPAPWHLADWDPFDL